MEKVDVNHKKMSVPSGAGAKIIHVEDNQLKVGNSEKNQSFGGLKHLVPDGSKK